MIQIVQKVKVADLSTCGPFRARVSGKRMEIDVVDAEADNVKDTLRGYG